MKVAVAKTSKSIKHPTMREKLIELLKAKSCYYTDCRERVDCTGCGNVNIGADEVEPLADYLLENGVVVLRRSGT